MSVGDLCLVPRVEGTMAWGTVVWCMLACELRYVYIHTFGKLLLRFSFRLQYLGTLLACDGARLRLERGCLRVRDGDGERRPEEDRGLSLLSPLVSPDPDPELVSSSSSSSSSPSSWCLLNSSLPRLPSQTSLGQLFTSLEWLKYLLLSLSCRLGAAGAILSSL